MASHASTHPLHDERRKSVRYSTQLQVRYGIGTLSSHAPVGNLSEGGLCIQTNEVYKTGTRIWIAIQLGDAEVQLNGEVMWAIRVPEHQTGYMEHGMGVQFLDGGPEWKRAFAGWKESL